MSVWIRVRSAAGPLAGPASGGTLMKRALFALLKPPFRREDRFLPKSLMTAFEVLINPWPCSFETPWIPWLLEAGERKKRERETEREDKTKKKPTLFFCKQSVEAVCDFIPKRIYLQVKLIRVNELRLYKAGGWTPCCSEKKSTSRLEEITWGLLGKRITWPTSWKNCCEGGIYEN